MLNQQKRWEAANREHDDSSTGPNNSSSYRATISMNHSHSAPDLLMSGAVPVGEPFNTGKLIGKHENLGPNMRAENQRSTAASRSSSESLPPDDFVPDPTELQKFKDLPQFNHPDTAIALYRTRRGSVQDAARPTSLMAKDLKAKATAQRKARTRGSGDNREGAAEDMEMQDADGGTGRGSRGSRGRPRGSNSRKQCAGRGDRGTGRGGRGAGRGGRGAGRGDRGTGRGD